MTLQSEIFEQADILQNLLEKQQATAQKIAQQIQSHSLDYIFLAARGTSDNAGRYAGYLWGAMNHLPIALATPSLFTYYKQPPTLKNTLVVGISQSGQSPDIISVVEEGHRQGCPTLVFTNNTSSPLAEKADYVFDILAGPEKAVAATKTYTAELMAIAMLSAALKADNSMMADLMKVPGWVREILAGQETILRQAERYRYMEQCVVLGRGFNYATAYEWSLKIKELTYVVADPYSPADFKHGPIALVESGFPVMAAAPSGKVQEDMLVLLRMLKDELQAELMVISDNDELLSLAKTPVRLPKGIPEWCSPITTIIPVHLFVWALTQIKGLNTEQPRTIHKITITT